MKEWPGKNTCDYSLDWTSIWDFFRLIQESQNVWKSFQKTSHIHEFQPLKHPTILLKRRLRRAQHKQHFTSKNEKIVISDASTYSVGGILEQKHESLFHSVSNGSQTLDNAEKSLAAHERELLAVAGTIRNWRANLQEINFIIYSYQYPIEYLETNVKRNTSEAMLDDWVKLAASGFQAAYGNFRWKDATEFSYKIIF